MELLELLELFELFEILKFFELFRTFEKLFENFLKPLLQKPFELFHHQRETKREEIFFSKPLSLQQQCEVSNLFFIPKWMKCSVKVENGVEDGRE